MTSSLYDNPIMKTIQSFCLMHILSAQQSCSLFAATDIACR